MSGDFFNIYNTKKRETLTPSHGGLHATRKEFSRWGINAWCRGLMCLEHESQEKLREWSIKTDTTEE